MSALEIAHEIRTGIADYNKLMFGAALGQPIVTVDLVAAEPTADLVVVELRDEAGRVWPAVTPEEIWPDARPEAPVDFEQEAVEPAPIAMYVAGDGREFPRDEVFRLENFMIHEPTGEVIENLSWKQGRAIVNVDDANEALEIRVGIEAELAAVQFERDIKVAAIMQSYEARIARILRRSNWWQFRFASELQAWTARFLEGKKDKSVSLGFGKLGFKKTQGGKTVIEALDKLKAIAWCKEHAPLGWKEVKTEQLMVSGLSADMELPEDLFTVKLPLNEFYCESGIATAVAKAKGGK